MQRTEPVGIIGAGFVGEALIRLFGPDRCRVYDPPRGSTDREAVNACPIAFICVPTPSGCKGQCRTHLVEESVDWCESNLIVIRSTVAPGTTDRLCRQTGKRIVFQPEYIGETTAHPLIDHHSHGFSVLGGEAEDTAQTAEFYQEVYHAAHRFYFCEAIEAELAKYMENSFYAAKVAFCNEWFEIARLFGVDYHRLRELWLADPRISRDHTFVYPSRRGFGGKCLPKDTAAIIEASSSLGLVPRLLSSVMQTNTPWRMNDSDYRLYAKLFDGSLHAAASVGGRLGPSSEDTSEDPDGNDQPLY